MRGELRLCGGQPLPPSLFTSETICVEQSLAGVTAEHVRRKSLDVTSVTVSFAGHAVASRFIRDPRLVVHGADGVETEARGLFDWLGATDDAADLRVMRPPRMSARRDVGVRIIAFVCFAANISPRWAAAR